MGKDSGNGEFSSGYPGSSGSVYWAQRLGRGEGILLDGDSVVMLHSRRRTGCCCVIDKKLGSGNGASGGFCTFRLRAGNLPSPLFLLELDLLA
jgi:hypothetical protein